MLIICTFCGVPYDFGRGIVGGSASQLPAASPANAPPAAGIAAAAPATAKSLRFKIRSREFEEKKSETKTKNEKKQFMGVVRARRVEMRGLLVVVGVARCEAMSLWRRACGARALHHMLCRDHTAPGVSS